MIPLLLGTVILISATCQAQISDFPTNGWKKAAPSQHGFDEQRLSDFINDIRNGKLIRPAHSLLIVRNGHLVVEEYFNGGSSSDVHTLQSVTKSISSTLVGVAMQQGMIKSLEQPVLSFFPEYDDFKNLDGNKRNMTLRHALTMRTGQAWTGESHLDALNRFSGDRMKYVLDYKMEGEPGNKWYYNSGIAVLLGGLIANATEMDTRDFAQQFLFDPLGIDRARWYSYRNIPHTGGGLYLRPQDMAKIGYLYLKDGLWEGKRILPENWVKEATTAHVNRTETIVGMKPGYGFMWWLLPLEKSSVTIDNGVDVYMAYGHWGQFIFIIPSYDMVVVWTNNNSASYREEIKPISLFYDHLLPAVSR